MPSQNQKLFSKGKVLKELPNGFYQGHVNRIKVSWQGKKFDAKKGTGINVFKNDDQLTEKYPFKIYQAQGLKDKMEVLRIDYNLPQNPFWVRLVVDEIVEISPDNFLGKVNIKLFGLIFTPGYFTLTKDFN